MLYHEGQDVKDTDPELPTCEDSVADSTEGGIDPLCVRYDIGKDLTAETLRALELVTKPGQKRGHIESISPEKITSALLALPPAANVKTEDEWKAALAAGIAGVSGTTSIYFSSGANSFGYMGSQALRTLKVFSEGSLPEGYQENDLRLRALTALEAAAAMNAFPATTKEALAVAKPKLLQYLGSTAYLSSLSRDEQSAALANYGKAIDQGLAAAELAILSKLRVRFIGALPSTLTAPLAFLDRDGAKVDLEPIVMGHLERLASPKTGELDRPLEERVAALTALKSYARSENYPPIADRVVADLKQAVTQGR